MVSLRYVPSGAGADNATLTVTGIGGESASIALSAAGVAAPPPPMGQLSVPASITMPDTTVGASSAPQSVTLANVGNAPVSVSSIASGNASEFTVGASTCATLSAGANCTFNVTFTPAATGLRSSTITVQSDGSGSPQAIVASGNGRAAAVAAAVEYHHGDFDHYFVTAIADEIAKLDNGTFAGWTRTGRQFNVLTSSAPGLATVCRFFSTTFAPKSSHFYTPDAGECTTVKANPNWQFEGEVFFMTAPALDGTCPSGTNPVYRLYNNGQGAAPNHRYTTDLAVRSAMLGQGWIPEGYGPIGVIMCAPI
jgi:hypothetical protein